MPTHSLPPLHKLKLGQVTKEMSACTEHLVATHNGQWFS
jgi:hypothetical protein